MNAAVVSQLADEMIGAKKVPTRWHRPALELAIEFWGYELAEQPDHGKESLRQRVKQAYVARLQDDGYGFAVITFLLITVLAAAISWGVQRLLDWLYPENRICAERKQRMLALRHY